jgi:hypothetical protein
VGIDAGIMEPLAEQAGRPAWTPFVNTDQGDLLLLVFALGGLLAGLALGWSTRTVVRGQRPQARSLLALGAVIPPAALLLCLTVGWVGTGSLAEAAGAVFNPLGSQVLSAHGGDFALFLFLLSGIGPGVAAGWSARAQLARRLPVRELAA